MSLVKRIQEFLSKLPVLEQIISLSKKFSLPGFAGVSIHDVVVFFFSEVRKERLNIRAGFIAFNFTLAIFPAIIFMISIIPDSLLVQIQYAMLDYLSNILPQQTLEFMEEVIFNLQINSGSFLFSAFTILLLLFFASNSMNALQNAFRKDYEVFDKRTFWKKRSMAFIFTIVILILFFTAIAISIAGPLLINKAANLASMSEGSIRWWLLFFNKLIAILLVLLTFSFILRYVPHVKSEVPFFSPGAILATILSIITSLGFAWYVNNFGSYNKLYGSLGAILVLMMFIFINSLTLLVGFELNTSIQVNRKKKELEETQV